MKYLTIGQLARKAEVNIDTIRYYERRGLLSPHGRRESGYRQYLDETVLRIRFMKHAKELGFFLDEIAEVAGKTQKIVSDSLMMATGIMPNTALNVESVGVQLDSRGFVIVDDTMKTTADHVWAAGDVTGRMPLVTIAGHQGAIAGENAATTAQKTLDYSIVPHTIFTSPQIASVGLTEREAEAKGIKCVCRELPMKHVPRAQAVHDTRGLIKIVAEKETGRVLGVHILSYETSEVIHQGVLILKNRMTVQEVAIKIDVYPTMSEMIRLCAQSFFKDVEMLSCCAE